MVFLLAIISKPPSSLLPTCWLLVCNGEGKEGDFVTMGEEERAVQVTMILMEVDAATKHRKPAAPSCKVAWTPPGYRSDAIRCDEEDLDAMAMGFTYPKTKSCPRQLTHKYMDIYSYAYTYIEYLHNHRHTAIQIRIHRH